MNLLTGKGNPDVKSREEIFAVHMKPLPLAADDLHALAQELAELTPGFSGALELGWTDTNTWQAPI